MNEGSRDLGACLRSWRGRVQPASVGVPAGSSRRTPGLRREELTGLAGLSVDYLVRLEQGRARNPSSDVLASLTRALQLTTEERDHLYALAGKVPPGRHQVPTRLTPGVQRVMDRLADTPVSVCDASWSLIAWNPMWAALLGDPSAAGGRDRNIAWRHFTGAGGRMVRTPAETDTFERAVAADLRVVAGRYPDDESLARLIDDLRRSSTRFETLWEERQVAPHRSDRKTVNHPDIGPITLDCDVLTVEGADLRIIVYTAEPASEDAERLQLLRVIGLQDLTPDRR